MHATTRMRLCIIIRMIFRMNFPRKKSNKNDKKKKMKQNKRNKKRTASQANFMMGVSLPSQVQNSLQIKGNASVNARSNRSMSNVATLVMKWIVKKGIIDECIKRYLSKYKKNTLRNPSTQSKYTHSATIDKKLKKPVFNDIDKSNMELADDLSQFKNNED
eukprot:478828_1